MSYQARSNSTETALKAELSSAAQGFNSFEQSPTSRGSVSQQDVDSIIRKKRKQREYKACYPCRSRKVKCDQNVPCKSCVDRHHPEYCTYHPPAEEHPPAKRFDNGATHGIIDAQSGLPMNHQFESVQASPRNASFGESSETIAMARDDVERLVSQVQYLEKSLADVKSSMRRMTGSSGLSANIDNGYGTYSPRASDGTTSRPALDEETRHYSMEGVHTRNEITGETVHVGGSSVPALVMALSRSRNEGADIKELLGTSMLPVFGLENESATYPFVSLWGMPSSTLSRVLDLTQAIPEEAECNRLFQAYRDTGHVVYPSIVDIQAFESDLLQFLITRAQEQASTTLDGGIDERSIYGKSLYWVGLLFAALAIGCQCSDLPRKQRELSSQVYVCCSFECLRITNFFSHSNLESIQTLLILGNVISNNNNAGVAWALMGLTIRLAQCLGLHKECPKSTPPAMKIERSKIWSTVIWQDSLLSITYDRASSTAALDKPTHHPTDPSATYGNWSYEECMFRLTRVGLDIVRERATPQDPKAQMLRITEQKQELQEVVSGAADYLKDSRCCRNTRDQLQHWALYLHMSYILSELCRAAISPNAPHSELAKSHKATCIESLINTVEAFVGLQNLHSYATRSWAALHRAISSALLLGILREPQRNEKARTLVDKFVKYLYEVTSDIDPTDLAPPMKRSLQALTKLANLNNPGVPATPAPTSATTLDTSVTSATDPINFNDWNLLDSPSWMNISPLLSVGSGDSPYTLMDQIIWGQKQSPTTH